MNEQGDLYEPKLAWEELTDSERDQYLDRYFAMRDILESAYADVKHSHPGVRAWVIDGTNGVLVHVCRNDIVVCITTVVWEDTHRYRLAGRFWKAIPYATMTAEALLQAVAEGIKARRAELIACRFCGKPTAPEMISRGACPKCEHEHLGIIH